MANTLKHLFLILLFYIQFSFIFTQEYQKCGVQFPPNKKEDCKPKQNELKNEETCCYVEVKDLGKPHCTKVSKELEDSMVNEIKLTLGKEVNIQCYKS